MKGFYFIFFYLAAFLQFLLWLMFAFLLPLRSVHFGVPCPGGMLLGKVRGKEHISAHWKKYGELQAGWCWVWLGEEPSIHQPGGKGFVAYRSLGFPDFLGPSQELRK